MNIYDDYLLCQKVHKLIWTQLDVTDTYMFTWVEQLLNLMLLLRFQDISK